MAGFVSPLPLPFGASVPVEVGLGQGPLPFILGVVTGADVGLGAGPLPLILGTGAVVVVRARGGRRSTKPWGVPIYKYKDTEILLDITKEDDREILELIAMLLPIITD